MKNYLSLLFVTVLFLSACSSKQFHQAPSISFKLPKSAKQIAFEDFFRQYDPKKTRIKTAFLLVFTR